MEHENRDSSRFVPPYPLAMVVCDAIWRDPGTGKRVLLGLFSTIHAVKFPAVHPMLAVYVALTDGRGRVPIRLMLVDAEEARQPVFDATQEVVFDDPHTMVEVDFLAAELKFDGPGEYRFQLLAADAPLMERRIMVNAMGGRSG